MEIEDGTLYDGFRYRVLEEMVEETKHSSGYFIMIVDKKSLGVISGAVSVLDLTQRGVTVIEQLEKVRKPMPEVDALYFLTPTHKSITRLTTDFIEQIPYRQVHLFFTGRVSDKLMRTIANSSVMPYVKTFKEVNCGFRLVGRDCFSLEHNGLMSTLFAPKNPNDKKELLAYLSQNLASVCGVMRELPYVCYQGNSTLAQQLALDVEQEIQSLYRKLPQLPIKTSRPILMILDRGYDLGIPLIHDVHYESLLKDFFEVNADGKVKYESTDNSGISSTKEAIINEKDNIWVRLRYEEIDEAQALLNSELKNFRNENKVMERAGDLESTDLKTMAKVASGLSNYNDNVSRFAVHRFLIENCLRIFSDDGITNISEIEQMAMTGFDTEKKEYKESDMVQKILSCLKVMKNTKEKLRLVMLAIVAMELGPNDRKTLTDMLPSDMALHLTKLSSFGLSLQSVGKTKKRLNKLYINSLQSRIPDITKIYNYYVPKISDFMFAAQSGTLDAEGFVFGNAVPPSVEEMQPQVKSLRKKQGAVSKARRKIIVFIIGGVSHAELRVIKDFPDMHIVMGGTKIFSPLEFVQEIMLMNTAEEVPDVDPCDVELDFR